MRGVLLAFSMVIFACGGNGATTTSTAPTSTTTGATPSTSATTPAAATTTTSAPADAGPTDCLEIWPEGVVQEVTGPGVEFFAANDDRTACTYIGDTGGIALAWRPSSLEDFEEGRTSVSATGPVVDREICDVAYSTDSGAALIVEAYSDARARTFAATISGADPNDALDWATALLAGVC